MHGPSRDLADTTVARPWEPATRNAKRGEQPRSGREGARSERKAARSGRGGRGGRGAGAAPGAERGGAHLGQNQQASLSTRPISRAAARRDAGPKTRPQPRGPPNFSIAGAQSEDAVLRRVERMGRRREPGTRERECRVRASSWSRGANPGCRRGVGAQVRHGRAGAAGRRYPAPA